MSIVWHLMVDWDNDGAYETDENARVKTIQLERGRKSIFESPFTGRCTIVLDNYDRRFDPWNTGSPLYPNVQPGRRAQLYCNVDGGPNLFQFTGRIDVPDVVVSVASGFSRDFPLVIHDGWQWLRDQERVDLTLRTNYYIGDAIYDILGAVGWVDADSWILGTSQLGVTTIIGGAGYGESSDIDQTTDVIPYIWVEDENAAEAINSLAHSNFGRADVMADGHFQFAARGREYSTTIDVTLTDADLMEIAPGLPWDWVKNLIRVRATPRQLSALQAIWTLSETTMLAPGESITLWAEFRDSNGTRVPATDVATPVSGTDYTANSAADGSGTNLTAQLSVSATIFSSTSKLVLTNNSNLNSYITLCQLRGKLIQALESLAQQIEDETSQGIYGARQFSLDLRWQQSVDLANDLAHWLLTYLANPREVPLIIFDSNTTVLAYDLGTKIRLNSAILGFDKSFRLLEIKHRVDEGGQRFRIEWLLYPMGQVNFWILGTSTLGVDTRLGF